MSTRCSCWKCSTDCAPDADGLVELFLSYDADFDSFDIYRNVVISLGRVVKEPMPVRESGRKGSACRPNDGALRRLALSGLVLVAALP